MYRLRTVLYRYKSIAFDPAILPIKQPLKYLKAQYTVLASKTHSVIAMETDGDNEAAQTYDVIERDTVPAPAPRSDDSFQERVSKLVKWLQPTDFFSPGNEFMKHRHSYIPGTGKWVHESAQFREWAGVDDDADLDPGTVYGDHNGVSCLHVRGVAGSGKSVFAANVVRELQDSGHVVLFFFFRQIVEKNHTARYLVRDFAAQLLPHSPPLVAALTTLSQAHAVRGIELDLVWPALVEAINKDEGAKKPPVFCVVDALDEMDDGDFDTMVARLVALGTTKPANARVLMTSRPLPHIERALGHPDVSRLRLDPALLSPDVARYVDARMAKLDPPLSTDKRELVKHTICKSANGLFLQARLVADNLAEGLRDGRITPETLPDTLDRLPRTLRAVYEDMLKEHARRSGVTAEQQAKILMCVTHASRPLRLIELGSLLSRMLNVGLGRGKDLVRAGCGRLLELLEDETVSVIHHSFTEFLHDVSRKDDRNAFPVLEDEPSHAMLAVLLLEYLDGCPHLDATIDDRREDNQEDPEVSSAEEKRRSKIRTDTRVNQPLASYAIENLFFHINKVSPESPSAYQLLAALDRYLVPGKPAFETWMLMNWEGQLSASVSVFHLITTPPAGALVPEYVLEYLIDKEPALLDKPDLDGCTPLAYAAEHGYSNFAEMLLAKGADPTLGGTDGCTPLHRAAEAGHVAVIRRLLDAGVDPLIKTFPVLHGWDYVQYHEQVYTVEEAESRRVTALESALAGDNHEVIRAFMPFIPPDDYNKCYRRVRAVDNVKALLETGKVDVDCFQAGVTRLFQAAQERNLNEIKLLLEHGADPNRRCDSDQLRAFNTDDKPIEVDPVGFERGPTPLHAFAGVRQDSSRVLFEDDKDEAAECLRVLIGAGADVNATMDGERHIGQDMTPLHFAVQKTESTFVDWGSMDKSEEILAELLLSAGADPNPKTKNGNTPLHLANTERIRLIEILVEHGADINAVNVWGRSPLLEMITRLSYSSSFEKKKPNVKVFQKLLELGADVKVTDEQGDTVFHHIMRSLSSFAKPKFLPFIKGMLSAKPDLNRRNNMGQPPLWKYKSVDNYSSRGVSANEHAEATVLRAMVAAGMDLNARDDDGRTFLWELGSRYGVKFKTVEKLITLGADPTAVTHDGKTLLHSHSIPLDWFRNLIAAGVRADALDKNGDTTIHAVLRRIRTGYADSLRELLQDMVRAGALPLAKNAKGQSALHVAGTLDKLEIVLGMPAFKGLDVNEADVDGLTPLHLAVALGEKAVWTLLRAGADPRLLTAGGLSPLHAAARSGDAGVVGLLLSQYRERGVLGTQVNLFGDGRAPLHYACRSGSLEATLTLLRNGADARVTDEKGLTLLHALAEFEPPTNTRFGDPPPRMGEIIRILQTAGAGLNAEAVVQDVEGASRTLTPLDMAVQRGLWEMVRGLLAHGVEPSEGHKQSADFILATNKEKAAEEARKAQGSPPPRGQTSSNRGRGEARAWRGRWAACPGARMPIEHNACFISGGQDILDAKAKVGQADIDSDDDVTGADIMQYVLRDGDYDTIKEYAQLGGDMLELGQYQDFTILHHLVQDGHTDLLEYFGSKVPELEAQEWVQEDEESCGTLLGTACERDLPSLHIIKLLVDEMGVDVNAVYNRRGYCYKLRGATALHILSSGANFWQVEALEYLLSKGANIEARNKDGQTPLLAAIDTQYPDGFWREETVKVLLWHGADVNANVSSEGTVLSGLSALAMSSQPGITKLLLENGVNVLSSPGILARTVREWMDPAIVKLLLDAGADPNEVPTLPVTQKEEVQKHYALHEAARPKTHYSSASNYELQQLPVIDLLVSRGANAYAPYPDGSFVLQAIIEDRGSVESLLSGVTRTNCNRTGHHGRTLLASACIPMVPLGLPYSDPKTPTVMVSVIHALLNVAANPLVAGDDGRTPLHSFCTYPGQFDEAHREAFITLARHGGPAAISSVDNQGRTPLHHAFATYASRSQLSPFAIQHLISLGADPTTPDPVTGKSALHFIAPRLVGESVSAAEAATLFRELALHIGINTRNPVTGETPAFPFAAEGWEGTRDPTSKVGHPTYAQAHDTTHAKALDVFVDLGADLKAVDARKRTLLHVTAWREEPDGGMEYDQREDIEGAFRRLMELGVDPRAEDEELRTAIDVAVAKRLDGVVRLFSEEGRKMDEERRARMAELEREDDSDVDMFDY